MKDIGVSCQKKSYGRGAGTPLVCKSGLEEDAGLCYKSCSTLSQAHNSTNYDGVGPVCWGKCPTGMFECGALCTEDSATCSDSVKADIKSVLDAVEKVAQASIGSIDLPGILQSLDNLVDAYGKKLCDI